MSKKLKVPKSWEIETPIPVEELFKAAAYMARSGG